MVRGRPCACPVHRGLVAGGCQNDRGGRSGNRPSHSRWTTPSGRLMPSRLADRDRPCDLTGPLVELRPHLPVVTNRTLAVAGDPSASGVVLVGQGQPDDRAPRSPRLRSRRRLPSTTYACFSSSYGMGEQNVRIAWATGERPRSQAPSRPSPRWAADGSSSPPHASPSTRSPRCSISSSRCVRRAWTGPCQSLPCLHGTDGPSVR